MPSPRAMVQPCRTLAREETAKKGVSCETKTNVSLHRDELYLGVTLVYEGDTVQSAEPREEGVDLFVIPGFDLAG